MFQQSVMAEKRKLSDCHDSEKRQRICNDSDPTESDEELVTAVIEIEQNALWGLGSNPTESDEELLEVVIDMEHNAQTTSQCNQQYGRGDQFASQSSDNYSATDNISKPSTSMDSEIQYATTHESEPSTTPQGYQTNNSTQHVSGIILIVLL